MSDLPHCCKRSEIDHVRRFVAYAKLCVNEARYYPPFNRHRYMVALALYAKCLTVAEATIVLLDAGFGDEAFGVTRTLIDIFLTLRYIANKDTDERAQLYYEFASKWVKGWAPLVRDYWPGMQRPLSERTEIVARRYRSPHSWSGKTVKEMALEPDTVEVDPASGRPLAHDFAYRVIYRWTSHYVHPTIIALQNHVVRAGRDNFVIRARRDKDESHMAVFNVACYVVNTMVCFYRCMGDPQPERVGTWGTALMKHLARRHR